jgi:glutaredoxin
MDIKLIVTKSCSHCQNIKKELDDLGLAYDVVYVEENPDIVSQFDIRHSPNIVVDNKVVCRGQLTEGELKTLLNIE